MKPAHLRQLDRKISRRDYRRHLEKELHHVDYQDAPQPRVRREHYIQQAHAQQSLPALQPEQYAGNLASRQIHARHDDAVEEEPEINRAESAHRARRVSRIPQLVKFQVRHHPGTAP